MQLTITIARLLNPIVWRRRSGVVRKLYHFALAEQASMVDMRQAARLTPSPTRAAAYLRHADDEARHARMFLLRARELARTYSCRRPGELRVDTEHLYEHLGERAFLAFVHYGEARARRQFDTYLVWFRNHGRDKDRALFEAIIADERRHETYTYELLVELAGSEAEAQKSLRRVAVWEAWRRWLRGGRTLAHGVYQLTSWVLYLALLPMVPLVWLSRPQLRRWRVFALPPAPSQKNM